MTRITSDKSILKDKSLKFVDMHHHSTASDGNKSPKLLAKVFAKKGIGLCIADHNQIRGSVQVSRIAKKSGLFAIPAMEITTKQSNDILAYFYNANDLSSFWEDNVRKSIRNNAIWNLNKTTIDIFELVDNLKDYNGIAALAHPLALRPKNSESLLNNKEFMKNIRLIESHNFTIGNYEKTMAAIDSLGKPIIAGSDSHHIGICNTLTGAPEFEVEAFLDSLLKEEHTIYAAPGSFFRRQFERFTILKNNFHLKAPKNE